MITIKRLRNDLLMVRDSGPAEQVRLRRGSFTRKGTALQMEWLGAVGLVVPLRDFEDPFLVQSRLLHLALRYCTVNRPLIGEAGA